MLSRSACEAMKLYDISGSSATQTFLLFMDRFRVSMVEAYRPSCVYGRSRWTGRSVQSEKAQKFCQGIVPVAFGSLCWTKRR